MNTTELAAFLKKHPDLPILQSTDAEGNSYSELDGVSIMYVEETYGGEETQDLLSKEDLLIDSEDGELPSGFKPVLVFYPI